MRFSQTVHVTDNQEEKKNTAETESADLIIKDIYYAGDFVETPYGNKSEETDDKFISVYNPTDHDISLENMARSMSVQRR